LRYFPQKRLIFISFQAVVTAWANPSISSITGQTLSTGATALGGIVGTPSVLPNLSNWDLLLGTGLAGCIGETCKIALLIGGVYLIVRKVISPTVPLIYIAVTGLFTVCLNEFDFSTFLPSILSGGLILGAVFMATDYTTSPNTFVGNIVYAVMLGLITAGLRMSSGKEVVSFAILIMNLIVPLIDKFIIPKPFGYQKPKKGGAN
jgi:electron transport complex protein RnfD